MQFPTEELVALSTGQGQDAILERHHYVRTCSTSFSSSLPTLEPWRRQRLLLTGKEKEAIPS